MLQKITREYIKIMLEEEDKQVIFNIMHFGLKCLYKILTIRDTPCQQPTVQETINFCGKSL